MGDWSMLEGQLVDTVGESLALSRGTSVVTGAVNTKGGWAEIIDPTTYGADGLVVIANPFGGVSYLIDIGIGASGSEVIIIPNLLVATGVANHNQVALFPIGLPVGTRIAARAQASSATQTVGITVGLISQGFLPSACLNRVTAYGANAATSGGVNVDPGVVQHTKNAYSQINGATATAIRALLVAIGGQANGTRATGTWLVDIAIGAAGSEQIILPDLFLGCHATGDTVLPGFIGPFFIDIPAGVRLAARAQCSIVNGEDRLFDIALYGLD